MGFLAPWFLGGLAALGVPGTVSDAVRRMAALAVAAGARGLVCSPQEVTAVRAEVGEDIVLITPGIRPSGAAWGCSSRPSIIGTLGP